MDFKKFKKEITIDLGDTDDEKKTNYDILNNQAKKWAKIGGILGIVFGVFLSLMLLGNTSPDSFLGTLFLCLIMLAGFPVGYYFYAKMLFYGFVVVKVWFINKNITAGKVATAAGASVLISYVLGGREAVQIVGKMWAALVAIVVIAGIYLGAYNYYIMYKTKKALGIA
ncbi:MAG: hypothetical protein IJX87_06445 [Clostridia bacterium]|nr:hypothetical protein [Clostridia bacterium]